jgi:hypothetical protein
MMKASAVGCLANASSKQLEQIVQREVTDSSINSSRSIVVLKLSAKLTFWWDALNMLGNQRSPKGSDGSDVQSKLLPSWNDQCNSICNARSLSAFSFFNYADYYHPA